MATPRVIRKYANRRLYDATASRHVTLEDIRRLIASGEQVQVLDDRSGEDLTRAVLLQIIADQEQFGSPVLSVQLLEGIIRFYGNPVQDMLSRYLEQSLGAVMQQQRTVQAQMAKAMETPLAPFRRTDAAEHGDVEPDAGSAALGPHPSHLAVPRQRRRGFPARERPSSQAEIKDPYSMELKGKTIAVTGAARGIGRALVEDFSACGADVALIDLRLEDLEDALAACRSHGVTARGYGANVARENEVSSALDRIVADFGRFDGIVNNAGIVKDALLVKTKEGAVTGKMSLDQWQAVIDVNLTGVFLCGREAAERMVKLGGGGVIVNISSISRLGNVGQSNYTAAKAGVAAMSVVWARELARYGIRVGAVAPGFTHTGILDSMRPELLEKMIAPVPVGRLGLPSEIAHAVRFIFENDFFTGRVIEVDGGLRL